MTGNENGTGISLLNGTGWTVNPSTGIISLSEEALQQIINPDPIEKWYILDREPLAKGQFAVVYHCYHRITGVEYAAKFSSRWRFGTDCMDDLLHEITVCALLQSQTQAVQLIDVFSTAREIVLVMEYAPGGDLQTLLDEELVPYEHDVISFIRQLLEVLVVIHDKNLVHLDIKPQNLVMMGEFPQCEVKLCDFEISRMLTKGHEIRELLGTPDYVAPEILHYEPITVGTDMWSVGVLTYVLLTGFLPFGGENDQETFMEISRCELDFPSQLFEDITSEAMDFIKKLLLRQPECRMSAQGALMHAWIRRNVKRPSPPNTLKLTHISSPSLQLKKITIPKLGHNSAEVSISCPLSDKSETCQENKKQISSLQESTPSLSSNDIENSCRDKFVIGKPVAVSTTGNVKSQFFSKSDFHSSRQNLERLKSLSKSREVLSGKVQMSNLKKCQSKSRERIMEAKLGFTKSHQQLIALRSLSQSVEALSVLSRVQQANVFSSSYNNICNKNERLNISEEQRMYQSLASIDQIDRIIKVTQNQYDSTASLNTDIYNNIITQRNTNINCKLADVYYENSQQSLKSKPNMYKGGRDICEIKCKKYQTPETNNSQRTYRSDKGKGEIIKTSKDRRPSDKSNIRDKRKRSSSIAESECLLKAEEKNIRTSISSIPFRRGSISHVEQRLQERKQRDKNSIRRKSTSDYERSTISDKSKLNKSLEKIVLPKTKRSPGPSKKRCKQSESSFINDVSQTPALESIKDPISSSEVPLKQAMFLAPILTSDCEPLSSSVKNNGNQVNIKAPFAINTRNFRYCDSETNNNVVELENKIVSLKINEEFQEKSSNISVIERIQNLEKVSSSSDILKPPLFCLNIQNHTKFVAAQRLGIISEEDNMSDKCDSKPELSRKISDSSEVGSLISNNSDVGGLIIKNGESSILISNIGEVESINVRKNDEIDIYKKEETGFNSNIENFNLKKSPLISVTHPNCQLAKFSNGIMNEERKCRSRSFSVHSLVCDTSKHVGRSRSKSFNYNNISGMPWDSICNGAIARAFEKLNFTDEEISPCPSPPNISPMLFTQLNGKLAV